MKLKSIASAIAVLGMGLSCAAWGQFVDPSANMNITQAYVKADNTTTPVTPEVPLVFTTTKLENPTLGDPVTSSRVDQVKSGVQVTNSFTTPTVNLGNSTSPVQGTLGGPGGVSGLGASNSVSSNYQADVVVGAGKTVKYNAGSTIISATDGSSSIAGAAGSFTEGQIIKAGSVLLTTSGKIGSGIYDTDHDFATKVTYGKTATAGLCTYCHTPHKASSTLLLWNRTMSSNTFKWDVSATTAGTALPGFSGSSYSGPSAKCLACHDGTVAIGDVGWFAGGGKTGTASLNPNKMGTVTSDNASARFIMGYNGSLGAGDDKAAYVTEAAKAGGTAVHPVAIPYPLNGAPNVYNGSTTGARLATNDFVLDPTANNIRLYSDVGGGNIVGKVLPGQTGMECSSCHDVHNKAATDKYFLRGKLVGSSKADGYICGQWHAK